MRPLFVGGLAVLFAAGFFVSVLPVRAVSDKSLVKAQGSATVYFVYQGKRYGFPGEKIFWSWYSDFSSVISVTPSELAQYGLAGNVTFKPGTLIKLSSDPKVYAISRYGILHWVTSEAIAKSIFGTDWNKKMFDLSDAFFAHYTVGQDVTTVAQFSLALEQGLTGIEQNLPGQNNAGNTNTNAPTNTNTNTIPSSNSITNTTVNIPVPPVVPPPVANNNVQKVGTCQIYPADNTWNTDISAYPIHAKSATWIAAITPTFTFHPGFTIPYDIVDSSVTPFVSTFCSTAPGTSYCFNSDLSVNGGPGSMPIPSTAHVQGGPNGTTDRHVVVIDTHDCKEYEIYRAFPRANGDWDGVSGGIFDLTTNVPRTFKKPATTAGNMPLYPGMVKFAEVQAGQINHALSMSIDAMQMQNAAIAPATGYASIAPNPTDPNLIPMGARFRLKASYDISWLKPWPQAYVMAKAMQQYGLVIGDGEGASVNGVWQGNSGTFNGESNPGWIYWPDIFKLKQIPASALEVVDTGQPLQY